MIKLHFTPQIWIAPLASLWRKRIVLNVDIIQPSIHAKQGEGYRWFGQPVDKDPSPESLSARAKKRRQAHQELLLEGKSVFHYEDNLTSSSMGEDAHHQREEDADTADNSALSKPENAGSCWFNQ